MSQEIREQLSALMDGELSGEETRFLMRRIAHDRALVSSWSNFHVARQALRRQVIVRLRPDFADSILARLEDETPVQTRRAGTWLRWASGGAIAASVAVAALVLSGPQDATAPLSGDSVASRAAVPTPVSPAATAAIPASNRIADFRPPMASPVLDVQPASASTAGFSAQPAPIDPRTQSYLVRHYDATGSNGQPGMLPYVLLIVPSAPQAASAPANQAAEQR
ncbi:sigma-E factor negative regulatory protein [Dokdonella sp.]|uniref:sigma-E factor negative regulatory protein n=1 Tax=Dokdonella sp. TaxID=2291710 RepID=UPI0035285EA3